jgi:hypothetical protein
MAKELQLIVTDEALLKEVTFNYEQLKASLTRRLKKYNELVVTEDAIKDAKEDRAELNSMEKVLAGKSKEIITKVLGGFDVNIKELRGMIKDASNIIDVQVKSFEQAVKDKKRKDIEQIYAENIGELKDLLSLNNFFQDTWLNVTVSMKKVTEELTAFIAKVRQDLIVIDTLNSEYALQIKDKYLQGFSLSAALAEKARLESVKKNIDAIAIPAQGGVVDSVKVDELFDMPWANISVKPKDYILYLECTENELVLVEKFLSANKINYKK